MPTDSERIAALEQRVTKLEALAVGHGSSPLPKPLPAQQVEPRPATGIVGPTITVGATLGTAGDTVVHAGAWMKQPHDAGGLRYELAPGKQFTLDRGAAFSRADVMTTVGSGPAFEMKAGSKLSDVSFDPSGGYLIRGKGDGSAIDGITASSWDQYLFYGDHATNLRLSRVRAIGTGSKRESAVRFDECVGTFTEFHLELSANHSALIRGTINGEISNGIAYGSTLGLNGLDKEDGGGWHGIKKFFGPFKGGARNAINHDACVAALRKARAHGVKTNIEVARRCLEVAIVLDDDEKPVRAKDVCAKHLDATMASRLVELAKTCTTLISQLDRRGVVRWGPGSDLIWRDGRHQCDASGRFFAGDICLRYPDVEDCRLPEDPNGGYGRPDAKIYFENYHFESHKKKTVTAAQFMGEVKRLGVKLGGGVRLDGVELGRVA